VNRSTTFIGPPHLGRRQDCDFLALDARNGDVLYRFNTGGAIGGGIVSYEEADKQYVAVMSGKPSPFWVSEIAGSPTVFLFALP
jgi:alcohol dehydrogenase (cytochrome c)